MSQELRNVRFVVKPLPEDGTRPNEFATTTMRVHPLTYLELAHDPEYTLYNHRLTPSRLSNATADEMYWKVRREVVLRNTGELPIEIKGPDAETLLNRVFTREISKVPTGRCSYQFACYPDGGMITDGVLLRLDNDRFWMVQADGDIFSWYKAHAEGLKVDVFDPEVWVSQVQGPHSLKVLAAVVDAGYPEPFNYFDVAEVTIAGQPVTITRSGFTNELGWEFYLKPDIDHAAVGDRIMEAGEPFGMIITSSESFRARRIEAGLLNAGTDFDATTTPFQAGLGTFVDMDKEDFIGKAALAEADQRRTVWGMRVDNGVARLGRMLRRDGVVAGAVTASGWSPFQRCGVAIVRIDDADLGPGAVFEVECVDDSWQRGEVCDLPMYDQAREIPRGKRVAIPAMS
jgi:glycine cleavage system aminomethyltransferase T